ncbi:uncharacterized protein [Antedon mediterranea]|uniref:uncharacterized protein n=1 Tax=Antedon mediterranea TaxID=105859 RepID=UPI003AF5F874
MSIQYRFVLLRSNNKKHSGSRGLRFWNDSVIRRLLFVYIILQHTVDGTDIRNSPLLIVATEGEPFQLDCTVRPLFPKVPIFWFRGNQIIAKYNPTIDGVEEPFKSKFTGVFESTTSANIFMLTIRYVEVSDASYTYKCAAKNSFNELIWSEGSELKVNEIPDSKYPLCEPRDQTFNENSRKSLTCRSEVIEPPVTLQWYKNSKLLNATTSFTGNEVKVKYDFEVKYEDATAEFMCVQSSSTITKLNGNCTIGPIFVNYLPRVTIECRSTKTYKNRSAIVKYNDVTVLICIAKTAHAYPNYKWKFSKWLSPEDYILSPDNRYVTFTAKEKHDNVMATCTVTNKLGSGSANITIYVTDIKNLTPSPTIINFPPQKSPEVPPSLIVAIIGICTLFIVIIMSGVLCCLKFYMHRQFINAHIRRQEIYQRHKPSIGCTIAQPEIYFEPKDSISQSTNTSDGTSSTKRSIGIQVLPQVNLELQDIHQQQTLPARYRGRPLPKPGRPSSPIVDCGCSFV